MTAFQTLIADGLLHLEEQLDNPVFTFNEIEIPCVPYSLGREVVIDARGNPVEILFQLIVRRGEYVTWGDQTITFGDSTPASFADGGEAPPISGQKITFNGVQYRVFRATRAPDDSHVTLLLKDPAR
jgi:hypothetical protein